MKVTNSNYAIIVSLRSSFVGKKRFDIEQFDDMNNSKTIIYVPNLIDDIIKLELAILLIEKIASFKIDMLINTNDISNRLSDLDNMILNIAKLKQSYIRMEKNIKNECDEYYKCIRDLEFDLQQKFNDIIGKIKHSIPLDDNKNNYNNLLSKYRIDKTYFGNFEHLKINNLLFAVSYNKNDIKYIMIHSSCIEIKLIKKKDFKLFETMIISELKNKE